MRALAGTRAILPGLGLCVAVTAAAVGFEAVETHLFGRAWLEALVLAILLGSAIRTAWTPSQRFFPGIAFGAKTVLEIAVVMLGASLSLATILAAGPGLLFGIAGVVVVAILSSYGIGRALGLHSRMAILVACGNSICGNSAIAATAPGDRRRRRGRRRLHRAFTAVLGVLVVLGLPLLVPLLGLSPMQYGVLAGLTVYAVPPGPRRHRAGRGAQRPGRNPGEARPGADARAGRSDALARCEPAARGDRRGRPRRHRRRPPGPRRPRDPAPGAVVHPRLPGARGTSLGRADPADRPRADVGDRQRADRVSMAALGLGVDVRSVAKAGARVTLAVIASLLALGAVSLGLIHVLGLV